MYSALAGACKYIIGWEGRKDKKEKNMLVRKKEEQTHNVKPIIKDGKKQVKWLEEPQRWEPTSVTSSEMEPRKLKSRFRSHANSI